jgi:hypothetical protein
MAVMVGRRANSGDVVVEGEVVSGIPITSTEEMDLAKAIIKVTILMVNLAILIKDSMKEGVAIKILAPVEIRGIGGSTITITTDVVTMEVEEGGGTSSLQKMIVSRMVKKMQLWDPIMVLKRILVPGRPWLR